MDTPACSTRQSVPPPLVNVPLIDRLHIKPLNIGEQNDALLLTTQYADLD